MLRRCVPAALVAALLSPAAFAAETTPGLDEIIARNIKARGGLERLKAVQALRMTGKMTVGPGVEAPFSLELKRPRKLRMELTLQGMTGIQAYDGRTGWVVMPFTGKQDPERMSDDDARAAEQQADFEGPLVDYATKGHKVELVGMEPVDGADAYKLEVTLKGGDVRWIYLDSASFLEVKDASRRTERGRETELESSIGDYQEVAGVMFPHAIEQGPKGSPLKQRIRVENVELDPTIDDARFEIPAPRKPGLSPAPKP